MKACNACHITVRTDQTGCPLCGGALTEAPPPKQPPPYNSYPDLSGFAAQYNFVLRLFIFVTLLGCGMSVIINLLIPTGFWWCVIVIAAAAYLWLSIPPLLSQGVDYGSRIVLQAIFTSILAVLLDWMSGYGGWSVTFVVPGLFSAGILAIGLMAVFNRTNWSQYVFHQLLMGLCGLIPLILYLLGWANNLLMVLITVGLALASLLVTIVFGDKSLKSDFRRRFHL
jgi:hypothetical protein